MTDHTVEADDAAAGGDASLADAPDAPPAPDGGDNPAQDESSVARARKDAASYRQRLRDTEAQRDTLAASVEAMRRQLIDGQAIAAGIRPAAFWAAGQEIDELLAEDGTVDPERVTAAIKTTCEVLGINPRRFTGTADQGPKRSATGSGVTDWAALLREGPSSS